MNACSFLSVAVFLDNPPGLNFINVLCTAFTCTDPKSVKRYLCLKCFCTPLGYTCTKAACRTLVRLTPELKTKPLRMIFQL